MRKLALIAVVLALFGAGRWFLHRPIAHDAGILADREPRQSEPGNAAVIQHGEYELTPLADFEIEARVLSREDYSLDAGSSLAPIDLALGWARMSDSAVIEHLDIEQSARFYTYRWHESPPIPAAEIVRSSANMHLIPADSAVARELDKVRKGSLIVLHGQLVAARRADGFHWTSSLTREDSGGGACELVLVDSVERL